MIKDAIRWLSSPDTKRAFCAWANMASEYRQLKARDVDEGDGQDELTWRAIIDLFVSSRERQYFAALAALFGMAVWLTLGYKSLVMVDPPTATVWLVMIAGVPLVWQARSVFVPTSPKEPLFKWCMLMGAVLLLAATATELARQHDEFAGTASDSTYRAVLMLAIPAGIAWQASVLIAVSFVGTNGTRRRWSRFGWVLLVIGYASLFTLAWAWPPAVVAVLAAFSLASTYAGAATPDEDPREDGPEVVHRAEPT